MAEGPQELQKLRPHCPMILSPDVAEFSVVLSRQKHALQRERKKGAILGQTEEKIQGGGGCTLFLRMGCLYFSLGESNGSTKRKRRNKKQSKETSPDRKERRKRNDDNSKNFLHLLV